MTVTNSDNVTFDFATDSFDSIPSTSDTNQYYYSEEIEKSSVVVNINGKFRHWSNTDLRFHKNDGDASFSMTFTAPEGMLITKIDWTGTSIKFTDQKGVEYKPWEGQQQVVSLSGVVGSSPIKIKTITVSLAEAPEAPDQAPILIGGSEFQGDRLELDYAMEVTFPAIEGHSVWYKLTAITTEPAENDIEAYAEVDEEGYTRYEGAFNVDPTLHNSLSYYVQNDANGMRSEVRTLAVGISTGVSLIEAEEAEAEYFNLRGIRVDRPAEGGVYLRRIGSKVVKVIK